ncbi:MAG TPA: calcium/proton exchanger [Rhodanobacteraceae bacterium]|nr:calcium/proton exchanger [Rhodanobacteraceae bacterium]
MSTSSRRRVFIRSDWIIVGGSLLLVIVAGFTRYMNASAVLAFLCSGLAVALLAALVGRSVEQLGDRFGAGATGVLQSALGNLPELFIALFALKAGLMLVVQAALIGSILANLLLVLGLAFTVGGVRHGTQHIDSQRARSITVLMLLAVAAMVVPSLASYVHTPAAPHEDTISLVVAVILLALFAITLPASLKSKPAGDAAEQHEPPRWPLTLALVMLTVSAVAAAFVSEWFVHALEPAMHRLDISDAFAGLVIVAIAGNAVENVVGIQLASKNRSEYAFSVVINSPLQIALVLAPALVILSRVFGFTPLTLVFPPMLVATVAIAVLVTAFITFDGESNWGEGVTMLALYAIIATVFWWG